MTRAPEHITWRHASRIRGVKTRICRFAATAFLGVAAVTAPVDAQVQTREIAPSAANSEFDLNVNSDPDIVAGIGSEFVGLSDTLKGVTRLPDGIIGSRLFDLDVANPDCFIGAASCLSRNEIINMKYGNSIVKSFGIGLDMELLPRASVRFNDEGSSALVGALVRIGGDLKDTSDFKNDTWYVFVGADAEAVTYSPTSVKRLTNGNLYYQDKIIVGDAQAGIGYRIGDADVSFGYFRREISSLGRETDTNGMSLTEDAAALSFTWRR